MKTTLEFLQAAITAKQASWDAISALEKHLVPDDDVTDAQADLITEWVESGAGCDCLSKADADQFLAEFEALA